MEDMFSVADNPDHTSSYTFQEPDWFTSLSDSELDLLTSIKELVIERAKNKGCEEVAGMFSLDMHRGLGVILLEDLKERMKTISYIRESSKGLHPLDKLHMMTSDNTRNSACLKADVCSLHFVTPKRKRKADGFLDGRFDNSKKRDF